MDYAAQKLEYELDLPEWPEVGRVTEAVLTVTAEGAVPKVVTIPVGVRVVPHLYGYHLQLITHELKYRDAAGNESPPKVLTAQLVDSFAPAAPGDMFIRIIGEVGEDGEAGPVGPQDGDLGGTSGPSDDSSPTVEDVPSPPSGIEPAPEPSGPRDLVI